jgi:hypothetical protein
LIVDLAAKIGQLILPPLQRSAGLNDVAADSATVENVEFGGKLKGERSIETCRSRSDMAVIRGNAQVRVALSASSTDGILGSAHGCFGAMEIGALLVSCAQSLIQAHLGKRRVGFGIGDRELLTRR